MLTRAEALLSCIVSLKEGGKPTNTKISRRTTGTMDEFALCNAVFGAMAIEDIEPFPIGTQEVGVRASNATGDGPLSNTVTIAVG